MKGGCLMASGEMRDGEGRERKKEGGRTERKRDMVDGCNVKGVGWHRGSLGCVSRLAAST